MTPPTLADARRRLQAWMEAQNTWCCELYAFGNRHHDPTQCPRLAAQQVLAHLDALEADARKLVEAMAAAKPALDSLAVIGHVHGMPYSGPTYGVELAALTARLDAK